jgi:hypothetical protein
MKSKTTKKPKTTKRTKNPSLTNIQKNSPPSGPNPPLSSINIAKVLSGFLTFRSSVKELSESIQKIEKIMDSTFQVVELASTMLQQHHRSLFPPFSSGEQPYAPFTARNRKKNRPLNLINEDDEEIPVIRLPEPREPFLSPSGPPFLPNINFQQILSFLSSPLIQRLVSQFFKPKSTPTISRKAVKKKTG